MRILPGLLLLLAGCGENVPPPTGTWTAIELFETPGKLGGCAIGELDARSPGNEAVAVSSEGRVVLARRGADGWESEVLLEAPGELIQVAVGDLLPQFEGDEIVAVGMAVGGEDDGGAGAVYLLWREDGVWHSSRIATPAALVHAVAILDSDPGAPGLEAVVGDFASETTQFSFSAWPSVGPLPSGGLPAPSKGMATAGGRLAVTSSDGSLCIFGPTGGGTRFSAASGLARVAFRGSELLVSSDSGELYLLEEHASERAELDSQVVFVEPGGVKGRGAVIADLDPDRPGVEYATAGYSGLVHLVFPLGRSFGSLKIYNDGQPLHHLAAGELVAETAGEELLCCGYGGRLVLLSRTSARPASD